MAQHRVDAAPPLGGRRVLLLAGSIVAAVARRGRRAAISGLLCSLAIVVTLAINLAHARDATDALARIFALATPADVAGVWIRGVPRQGPSLSEAAR